MYRKEQGPKTPRVRVQSQLHINQQKLALHGKPYDGHTLKKVLEQVTKLTGVKVKEVQVDLGYKGHGISEIDDD